VSQNATKYIHYACDRQEHNLNNAATINQVDLKLYVEMQEFNAIRMVIVTACTAHNVANVPFRPTPSLILSA